jgi:hypothetical protein
LLFHSLQQLSGSKSSSFSWVLNLSGFVACAGLLVHSFVDFNLHLPANALLFFLMATLATSPISASKLAPNEPTRHHPRSRKH